MFNTLAPHLRIDHLNMLLEINNLTLEYKTEDGPLRAAEDVSLTLEEGETRGLVGESGCGKTTVAKAILRLLPENGRIVEGEILYRGQDLTDLPKGKLRKEIRWKEISWIAQNAMNTLDPVWKVGSLMVEAMRQNEDISKADARERSRDLLSQVGLEPGLMTDYGHELSGGQRQRVSIALALTNNPSVIIADEPTTGLDVMVQEGVLQLLREVQEEFDTAILLITHDMAAVGAVADSMSVMYGGQIAEQGSAADTFKRPTHPYTIGLQNAFPTIESAKDLVTIPGAPPDLVNPPSGCRFKSRCPFATEECKTPVSLETVRENHAARCHYTDCAEEFRERGKDPDFWRRTEQVVEQ